MKKLTHTHTHTNVHTRAVKVSNNYMERVNYSLADILPMHAIK